MELYMDDKWKLSKKGSRSSASRREPSASSTSTFLKRSTSLPSARTKSSAAAAVAAAAGSPRSFTSRCSNLVKEQRARFYIMRRCVTMLICWRDYP